MKIKKIHNDHQIDLFSLRHMKKCHINEIMIEQPIGLKTKLEVHLANWQKNILTNGSIKPHNVHQTSNPQTSKIVCISFYKKKKLIIINVFL